MRTIEKWLTDEELKSIYTSLGYDLKHQHLDTENVIYIAAKRAKKTLDL